MAYAYNIEIDMNQDTLTFLQDNNYYLYAFKAVQSAGSGQGTSWFVEDSNNLLLNTTIGWNEVYRAYISTSEIIPNGTINSNSNESIQLGQVLNVDQNGGLTVTQNGVPNAIAISNGAMRTYTCGVNEEVEGSSTTLCAFTVAGSGGLIVIEPIEQVFLMFATQVITTATVIVQSFGPGMMVDLTGVSERTVSYDKDNGWEWGDQSWGESYPALTDLNPLLIQSQSANVIRLLKPKLLAV